MKHIIDFILYTGRQPGYCNGSLYMEVDGEIYVFSSSAHKGENVYPPFWKNCCVGNKWEFWDNAFPEVLLPYADEIKELFVENVDPCSERCSCNIC